MTLSLTLACCWVLLANAIAMFPSRRNHWPAAYALIALGIPLVGYVTWQNGPVWGMSVLIMGASMLRWPVIYLGRWCARKMHGKGPSQQ